MSKSAIIVLVLIALGLGGMLLIINQQPKGPGGQNSSDTPSGPAFEIDVAQVQALSISRPGEPTRSVFKTEDNSWVYAELPASATPDSGWPADSPRIQSALRSLTPIPAAGDASGATIDETAPTIELRLANGTMRTLKVEQQSVGGNVLAQIDEDRLVLIQAGTVSAIFDEGPSEWRVKGPLAGIAGDASRLTITAGDRRVALAKVENRWIMRAPISARADESVIRTVLEAILKMRIAEFAGAEAIVSEPVVTIEAERDDTIRNDGSARRVTSRTLDIGPAASGGTARLATLRGSNLPALTPLVLERGDIQTDQQFANLARPEAYLSKIAVPERRADIGIILFRPLGDSTGDRGFRRDIEGWNEMRPDGGMRTAELPDRDALTGVLNLLCDTPGQPRIAAEVEDFRPLTRVELYTLDDSDLGTLQVGYAQGMLAVRRTNVLWLYPDASVPALFMLPLPDQVEPEAPREPSNDPGDADPQDNK